jgi:hypothetical protein
MKENIVAIKPQPEAAPGKVIPTRASALRTLADSLAACTAALATAEREQRDAAAILAEAAPAGFDHALAGRLLAEARVSDLLNGGSTVDGVRQRLDREISEIESAAAAFASRQAVARGQAEHAGPMIAALRAQAVELDRATRHELARLGRDMEPAAAQALADAVAEYSRALIEYRATVWLQDAETVGEHGRQFSKLAESDLSMVVPDDLMEGLPAGWVPTSTRNQVRRDRYDLAGAVGERRRALMESATGGVYPKAGAGLHRIDIAADQAGG